MKFLVSHRVLVLGLMCWVAVASAPIFASQTEDEQDLNFFEQKIRPVLVQHCYACHSQQASAARKLQGGLFLDTASGVLAGGDSGPSLIPGKSAESLLISALRHDGLQMPPSGRLADEVVSDFVQWIDRGAIDPRQEPSAVGKRREISLDEGREWWAFRPLQRVVVPEQPDAASPLSPVDRFLHAAQRRMGLQPAGRASRERLIRRACFELIGLPPTPEQVDAFLQDPSPTAFERVVDSLLNSPRYGEKWARHWLDTARYAESGGYEFDGFRPGAFHYRDWVIQALNDDLPYDEFVRMQLAGDKLVPDDLRGAAATGFLVAGPYPGQITAKTVEGIRYDQLDDMLMTIGGSMLGLTLGCVRCHDHKYDPLRQQDYYAVAAALGETVHGTRTLDRDPSATLRAYGDYQQAGDVLREAMRRFARDELPGRFAAWCSAELARQPAAPRWQVLDPITISAERSWLRARPGGLIVHDGLISPGAMFAGRLQRGAVGNEEQYVIRLLTHQQNITALRLDAFVEKSLTQTGPGLSGDGSFQLTELTVTARDLSANPRQEPAELRLTPAYAAFEDVNQPLSQAVDGKPETAWVVRTTAKHDNAAVFALEPPLAGSVSGTELVFHLRFRDFGLARMRLSLSTEPGPATWAGDFAPQHAAEIRAILSGSGNELPESLRETMMRWFSPFDRETAQVFDALRDHDAAAPRPDLTEVYTTTDGGQEVFLLRRGEVQNKQGRAEPGVLEVLQRGSREATIPVSAPAAAVSPRIALADWITDVEYGAGPLLARVMANRIWQHHFGEGIVGTPNDFGAQGEAPVLPDLLEWLATELVANDWRLKSLHRQILLSETWQRDNTVTPENQAIDPENRFLWHHRPVRLEAEPIRDALLAVGGNLDLGMYGPGITDDVPRRSVYLRVKRSEMIPLMTMFDAPEPTQSVGERSNTTVPTQSLTIMNSPFVRGQSERLARRIRPSDDVPLSEAVDHAWRTAFARMPNETERTEMLQFLQDQLAILGGDSPENRTLALEECCQVLLSLSEFIYVD